MTLVTNFTWGATWQRWLSQLLMKSSFELDFPSESLKGSCTGSENSDSEWSTQRMHERMHEKYHCVAERFCHTKTQWILDLISDLICGEFGWEFSGKLNGEFNGELIGKLSGELIGKLNEEPSGILSEMLNKEFNGELNSSMEQINRFKMIRKC